MDVKINTHTMNQPCPKKTRSQCVWWEVVGISLLVFLAVFSIVFHVHGLAGMKEIILVVGATLSILWALWVVRTFRSIMIWWADLQNNMSRATQLLEETKQDIKEIKSINNEFSSR